MAKRGEPFFLGAAIGTALVAFTGFFITYFGPMAAGDYPVKSATVHLHGWSFFLWYLLFPVQALLINTRNIRVHRILGMASVGLATVMVMTGSVVATVQIHLALQPEGSGFWAIRGLPILSLLLPFSVFFVEAIRRRKRPQDHKRLLLMASAVGLPAAASRLVGFITGIRPPPPGLGFAVAMLFVVAGIVYDQVRYGSISTVYKWGLPLAVGAYVLAQLLARTALGDPVKAFFGWIGGKALGVY